MTASIIVSRLHHIVAAQPYPLLFATISGAHLYGFPSPDSDYDLRGAHVLPLESVVGLEVQNETVQDERVIEGLEMDIVSHDVKKFFGLLLKKNGYVLEQLYSPLIVHTTPEHAELKEICSSGCKSAHYYRRTLQVHRQVSRCSRCRSRTASRRSSYRHPHQPSPRYSRSQDRARAAPLRHATFAASRRGEVGMTHDSVVTVRRSISLPALMSVAIAAGLGFQGLSLYAIWVTFGGAMTLAFYAVGGLAVLLQRVIAERRVAAWSAGE